MKRIGVILLTVAMVLTVSGCGGFRTRGSEESKIIARIEEFQNCCHTLDFDGLLDCIDPEDVFLIRAAIANISWATNMDSDTLLNSTADQIYGLIELLLASESDWPEISVESTVEDYLNTVQLKADTVTFSNRRKNDYALVNCAVTITINREKIKTRTELNMVKSDGEWYIDWM